MYPSLLMAGMSDVYWGRMVWMHRLVTRVAEDEGTLLHKQQENLAMALFPIYGTKHEGIAVHPRLRP